MIGDLNRRITLQEEIKVADGAGGFTSSWQNVADNPEIYASIIPLTSGEILHYSKLSHKVNYQITIRYRDDITSAMRITHANKSYEIKSVINIQGKNKYLKILAEGEG